MQLRQDFSAYNCDDDICGDPGCPGPWINVGGDNSEISFTFGAIYGAHSGNNTAQLTGGCSGVAQLVSPSKFSCLVAWNWRFSPSVHPVITTFFLSTHEVFDVDFSGPGELEVVISAWYSTQFSSSTLTMFLSVDGGAYEPVVVGGGCGFVCDWRPLVFLYQTTSPVDTLSVRFEFSGQGVELDDFAIEVVETPDPVFLIWTWMNSAPLSPTFSPTIFLDVAFDEPVSVAFGLDGRLVCWLTIAVVWLGVVVVAVPPTFLFHLSGLTAAHQPIVFNRHRPGVGTQGFATFSCPNVVGSWPIDIVGSSEDERRFQFSSSVPAPPPLSECAVALNMSYVTALSGGVVAYPIGSDLLPVFFTDGLGPQIVASNLPADGFFEFPDGIFDLVLDLDGAIAEGGVDLYCYKGSDRSSFYSYPNYMTAINGTRLSIEMNYEYFGYDSFFDETVNSGSCELEISGFEVGNGDPVDIVFLINWREAGVPTIETLPWVEVGPMSNGWIWNWEEGVLCE